MFYIIVTISLVIIYLIIQHFIFKKWEKQMIENINNAFNSIKSFLLIKFIDSFKNVEEDIDHDNSDDIYN